MSRRLLLIIAGIIIVPLGVYILAYGHRPYFNWSSGELARYLYENNRSPKECWDLIVFDPMGPQPAVQRASCVYDFAEMSKDPDACRELLPGQYGRYCVASIVGKTIQSLPDIDGSVECNIQPETRILECVEWPAGTWKDYSYDECDTIVNDEIQDLCREQIILESGNISLCQNLISERNREDCIFFLDKTCTFNSIPALRSACEIQRQYSRTSNISQ